MKEKKQIYLKPGLPVFDWENPIEVLGSNECPLANCQGSLIKLPISGDFKRRNGWQCDICHSILLITKKTKRWKIEVSFHAEDIQNQIEENIKEKDSQCTKCSYYHLPINNCRKKCQREDTETLFIFIGEKIPKIHYGKYHPIYRKHKLWGGNIPKIRKNALSRYRIKNKLSAMDLSKKFGITHRAMQYHLAGRPFPLRKALIIMELTRIPLFDLMITPEFIEREGLTKEQVYGKTNLE
jgi:hypothetical protein